MPDTQLVEAEKAPELATIGKTEVKYIFVFGKHQYYIPASSVVSYPKKPNLVDSPQDLGTLLATKAPDKWKPYTHPDFLMQIKGDEGSCVFTTFHVEGHMEEQRFVRFISGSIAEKCFPHWIEEEEAKRKERGEEEVRESKQKRLDVLKWTKKKDCPSKAQINPEMNKWPSVDKCGYEEAVKSCKIEPEARKRQKTTDSNKDIDHLVSKQEVVKVGPPGSYMIVERPGALHIIQYHSAGPNLDQEESAENGAE